MDRAVPCQTQPCQVFDDQRLPFRAAAVEVGVFHPEQEFPACRAGHVMREDGGIGVAEVQGAGGRGGEAGAEHRLSLAYCEASQWVKLSFARSV